MDCIFCKIIHKGIPAQVIYENDKAIAVLDIHPRAPGHSVVLPKRHVQSVLELDEADIGPVFGAVKAATAMLKTALEPDGFNIGINQGRASGQAVDHLHIHVIPRWNNDGGSSIHAVVNNPPSETLEEIAARIKRGINH